MANKLSPILVLVGQDSNGTPRSGAKLFAYTTGTQVKATLYSNAAGTVQHTNPVLLNSSGEIADVTGTRKAIWHAEGTNLDWVLAPSNDTDPPASPYWTLSNVPGINDVDLSSIELDSQWLSGGTPTFVSSTVVQVAGDQTSTYTIGRRVHTTNSGGEVYSTVVTSSLVAGNTQITLLHDSGSLDSGISVIEYGLLSASNNAVPGGLHYAPRQYQNLVHFNSGLGPNYSQNWRLSATVSGGALTITLLGNDGNALSSTNAAHLSFRSVTATSGAYVIRSVAAPLSLTVPSGASLGFANSQTSSIDVYASDNAGTVELAVLHTGLADESVPNSTTAMSTSSDSAGILYSASARTNLSTIYLGRVTIQTGATAGDWTNSPSKVTYYSRVIGANVQSFTSSGTWFKPVGFGSTCRVHIQAWGGGAGGASTAGGSGGGGGGGYIERWLALSDLGTSQVVTVGAGGAAATNGGQTSVGSLVTVFGGTTGSGGSAGAGGGFFAAGDASSYGGALYGGGAGGVLDAAGNNSVYGGGGGAGGSSGGAAQAGGTSKFAGSGGAGSTGTGTAGSAPAGGGGGGATGGAGARGEVRITVFP